MPFPKENTPNFRPSQHTYSSKGTLLHKHYETTIIMRYSYRMTPMDALWEVFGDRIISSGLCAARSGSLHPCQFYSRETLYNHPHLSSGVCTIGQKWPQYLGT
jgi:hypothetical protein